MKRKTKTKKQTLKGKQKTKKMTKKIFIIASIEIFTPLMMKRK